jgi:cell division protein FtsN
LINERKAVGGFIALLAALLGFYTLGLRQGRLDIPLENVNAAPESRVKSKAKSPDVRSELEFINSARLNQPDTKKRNPGAPDFRNDETTAPGYAVQLSGFDSREEAEQVSRRLQAQGFNPRISNSGLKHRVEIGPFRERMEAESAAAKLGKLGFSTSLTAR